MSKVAPDTTDETKRPEVPKRPSRPSRPINPQPKVTPINSEEKGVEDTVEKLKMNLNSMPEETAKGRLNQEQIPVMEVAVVKEPETPKTSPKASKMNEEEINSQGESGSVKPKDSESKLTKQKNIEEPSVSTASRERSIAEYFLDCIKCAATLLMLGSRRILRILVVTILISQTIYLPVSFVLIDWFEQEQVNFELTAEREVVIGMTDSNLVFQSDDKLTGGTVQFQLTKGGFRGCKPAILEEDNSFSAIKCDVIVKVSSLSAIPPMKISAISAGKTIIRQAHGSELYFKDEAYLKISANSADVSLNNVNLGAGGIDIRVSKGSVHVENMNVSRVGIGNTAGTLLTERGDVLVTTSESLQVEYQHPEASYCFAAANVTILSEECTFSNQNASNVTTIGEYRSPYTTVSCSGETILCAETDADDCPALNPPKMIMKSVDGSMYVTVEKARVQTIDLGANSIDVKQIGFVSDLMATPENINSTKTSPALYVQQGIEMIGGPKFSKLATFGAQEAAASYKETPEAHHFVIYNLRAPGLLADDKFFFTNIPVYLVAEPWLLKSLSAMIISPTVNIVDGRLKAAVCPYYGALQGPDKYKISKMLKEKIGSQLSTDEVGFKTHDTSYNKKEGAPWQLLYIYRVDGDGNVYVEQRNIWSNHPLVATIGMSFLLALIVCIAGGYKVYLIVKSVSEKFFAEIEHVQSMQNLNKLVNSAEYTNPRYVDDYLKNQELEEAKRANGEIPEEIENTNIPYPFALSEMAMDIKRRNILNSLEDFLDHHSVKVLPHEKASTFKNLIPLFKFKEMYESHCFQERLQMRPLTKSSRTLQKFGVRVKTIFDGTTDSFLRIRFCTEQEKTARKDIFPLPNEDSLTYFVRKHCVVSPYDSDTMLFREFTRRYESDRKTSNDGLAAVPVTKRAMKKLGVIYKRMSIKYVEFQPFKLGDTNYRVDITRANSVVSLLDEIEDGEFAEVASAFLQNSLVYDLTVSGLHWFIVMLLGLPSVIVPLLICMLQDDTSALPDKFRVTGEDALNWSYSLGYKLYYMRMPQALYIIFIIGWGCTLIMFIELILYYSIQSINLVSLADEEPSRVRKPWLILVYFCMSYTVLLWVWYIGLALMWMILGCLINPNVYLPYAAAAATFLVFFASKAGAASIVFAKFYTIILKIVRKTFANRVIQMFKFLEKMEQESLEESNSQDPSHIKAVSLVESDKSLSKILENSGIDLSLAVGLAKGQENAIAAAAEFYGMNYGLMYSIVACARRNKPALNKAVNEISKIEGISVKESTIAILFHLTQTQDEQALRLSLKEAIIHALAVNDQAKDISPHQIESVVSVGRGNIGRIVDICNELAQRDLSNMNQPQKRVKCVSAFLELLRNDSVSNVDLTFATDWKDLSTSICKLPMSTANGILQIRLGRCRGANVDELANILKVSPFVLKLLVAIAKDSPNEFRVNGPGSQEFSDFLGRNYGVHLEPSDLLALSAIARSSIIKLETLAAVHGISQEAAQAVGHLLAQERGSGNVQIGLIPLGGAGHLKWISDKIRVSEPVLSGLFAIAGCRVGEKAVEEYVQATFEDFVRKIGKDEDKLMKEILMALVTLTCSNLKERVIDAVKLLAANKVIKKKYCPLILLSRGLMGPEEFFDRDSRHYKCLCMSSNSIRKYLGPKKWKFESNGEKEPMSDIMWSQLRERRRSYLTLVSQCVMKHGKGNSLKEVRDFIFMETKFPKNIESYLSDIQQVGTDAITWIRSLYFLGVAPYLKNRMEKQRVYQSCSRLYNLEVPVFEGLMNIGYADHLAYPGMAQEDRNDSPNMRRGNALKQVICKFDSVSKEEQQAIRDFIDDYIPTEEAARRAHIAVPKLAKRLSQPELTNVVIARDHEEGFGASATGDIDGNFYKVLLRFMKECNILPNSNLDKGLKALVNQNPNEIGCLGHCLGVDPKLTSLSCKLFGTNTVESMLKTVKDAIKTVEDYEQPLVQNGKVLSKKKKKKKNEPKYAKYWWQPEPLGRQKLFFDAFILILSLVYCVLTPYRLLAGQEPQTDFVRGTGPWLYVDLVGDMIFLFDVLLAFITPWSLPNGSFTPEIDEIAFQYIKSWFFPDLLASVPFSLIELIGFSTTSAAKNLKMMKVLKGFRLLKLLRILRLRKTIAALKKAAELLAFGDVPVVPVDYARAYASFMAESDDEFPLETTQLNQGAKFRKPSQVLAHLAGVNRYFVQTLLHIKKNEQQQVKDCILNLVAGNVIPLEETICRGLTSLATGAVDSIEDIASMLGLDEDTCEGLAFIANSVTANITLPSLSSSGSLNKICMKLGLELTTVSALLAIVNQDYNSGDVIDKQLSLVSINGRYLKAILCGYSNDVPHDPRQKTEDLKLVFGPLISLFDKNDDHDVMAALVRLVQGDCTTIRKEIGDKLGFSKQERDILCALILVLQVDTELRPYIASKVLDFSPSESPNWDATRDAGVCSKYIARVLKVNESSVATIIAACKGDLAALETITECIPSKNVKETKRKLRLAGGISADNLNEFEEDEEEEDENGGNEKNGTENNEDDDDADSVASSQFSSSSAGSSMSRASNISVTDQISSSNESEKLYNFIATAMNNQFPASKAKDQIPLNVETVRWIIHICNGSHNGPNEIEMTKQFVKNMRNLESESGGTPAVTFKIVRELMAFAAGMFEHWDPYLWGKWSQEGLEMESEDGMFAKMGFNMNEEFETVTFLSMFAQGIHETWEIKKGGSVVSSKIHPDTRIVQAVAALAANNADTIVLTLPSLCEQLATDSTLIGALVSIAIGDETRMQKDVESIATRVNLDAAYTQAFIAGASLDDNFVSDRLNAMCDKLGIKTEIAACVILATQCQGNCSIEAWIKLCTLVTGIEDENLGIEKTDNDPRYYFVEMLARMLRNESAALEKYGKELDGLLGLENATASIRSATSGENEGSRSSLTSVSSLLHAIANNNIKALPEFLKLTSATKDQISLISSVVDIFNRTYSNVQLAEIDEALTSKVGSAYSGGFFTAFGASLVGELDIFAVGIDKLAKNENTIYQYFPEIAAMFVSMMRRDGHTDMKTFRELINRLHNSKSLNNDKLLNKNRVLRVARKSATFKLNVPNSPFSTWNDAVNTNPNKQNNSTYQVSEEIRNNTTVENVADLVYSILVGDVPKLLQNVHLLGVDRKLASDILVLINKDLGPACESKVEERMGSLAETLISPNPAGNPSPLNVKNLLLILSNGFSGVGNSRGLSGPVTMLAGEYLTENRDDKHMLAHILLASKDSPSHMDKILKSLDSMLTLVMETTNLSTSISTLVKGLVNLWAPTDSAESRQAAMKKAFVALSRSYKIPSSIIQAIYGLNRGRMDLVRKLGEQLGEFSTPVIENLFFLIMRLSPLMKVTSSEKNDDRDDNKDSTIDDDAEEISPDIVFARCDRDGNGYITIDEFEEALKIYQLKLNKVGLLKLFLYGNEEKNGLLTPDQFQKIVSNFEDQMVNNIMKSLGKNISTLFSAVLVAVSVLLLLFGFLFLGISTFSSAGAFNAGTSGSLFVGLGNALNGEDDDDEDEGDDEDGGDEDISEAIADNIEMVEG